MDSRANIKLGNIYEDDLEDILVLISKSRHIDIESVGKFIQSAINEVFVSDSVIEINEDVTDYLPRTATIESYNNKLDQSTNSHMGKGSIIIAEYKERQRYDHTGFH